MYTLKSLGFVILMAFSFLVCKEAVSQIKPNDLPDKVQSSFEQEFGNVEKARWTMENNHYEVEFMDEEKEIVYDKEGNIVEREKEIDPDGYFGDTMPVISDILCHS